MSLANINLESWQIIWNVPETHESRPGQPTRIRWRLDLMDDWVDKMEWWRNRCQSSVDARCPLASGYPSLHSSIVCKDDLESVERVSGFKEAWMTLNLAYNMCWDRQVETNLRRWHSLEKRRPAVRSSKSSNSGNQIFYFPSQSNLLMYECLYKSCVWFLKNGLPRWSSLKSTHKY